MHAYFDCFTITLTKAQALSASHPGPCDTDVAYLLTLPTIQKQLSLIPDDDLVAELSEYGAWDDNQLANRADNEAHIIWIAAGNIREELYEKAKNRTR